MEEPLFALVECRRRLDDATVQEAYELWMGPSLDAIATASDTRREDLFRHQEERGIPRKVNREWYDIFEGIILDNLRTIERKLPNTNPLCQLHVYFSDEDRNPIMFYRSERNPLIANIKSMY